MHFYVSPSSSIQNDLSLSHLLFRNETAKIICQVIARLAEMSPCHDSAKGAHYIVSVLATIDDLVADIYVSTDVEVVFSRVGSNSFGLASEELEQQLLSMWNSSGVEFVGSNRNIVTALNGLEIPPFWLRGTQNRGILPART